MRATSLFLLAVGAILVFAVDLFVDGVDLVAVGYILMGVGALGLLVGFLRAGSSTRIVREASADGSQVVERRSTTGY